MSLITPIIVKLVTPFVHHVFHCITSPIGFSNPSSFAVASLIINPVESLATSLAKSRPLTNCQPNVFPYSGVTVKVENSGMNAGSFPFHSKPPFEFQTSL